MTRIKNCSLLLAAALLLACLYTPAHPGLSGAHEDNNGHIEVLIMLKQQADSEAAAERARTIRLLEDGVSEEEKTAVRRAVFKSLRDIADGTQEPLLRYLENEMAAGRVGGIKSFFIVNLVYASIDPELWDVIEARPDVASVRLNETLWLEEPARVPAGHAPAAVEWNITRVRAPEAWSGIGADGSGIVVGIIDSGVDLGHEALNSKYRGADSGHAYNWYDPFHNTELPDDWNGHGTHVAGIIAGSAAGNGIGVAPGARWMAARGFDDLTGRTRTDILLACMQFMLAPTPGTDGSGAPDPSMAPDIVNNSWGTLSTLCDPVFRNAVRSWRSAGILPVFAAGNLGPGPGTISSPGNYRDSFAVGATDSQDNLANFSSRGPGACGNFIKPNISAPGVNIRSAMSYTPDRARGYMILSGTSMAAPHAAGVAALMLSADPGLTVNQLEQVMMETAEPLTSGDYPESPNHGFGHGMIDAVRALSTSPDDIMPPGIWPPWFLPFF